MGVVLRFSSKKCNFSCDFCKWCIFHRFHIQNHW